MKFAALFVDLNFALGDWDAGVYVCVGALCGYVAIIGRFRKALYTLVMNNKQFALI